MSVLHGVRALLVDLDGTTYQDGALVPGAASALAEARRRGLEVYFATNTTSRSRAVLGGELRAMGLPVPEERLFSAAWSARAYLLSRGLLRGHLVVSPRLLDDLAGIETDDAHPEVVVVGDVGEGFSYERLNTAFRFLLEGAELVALARNRYFRKDGALVLDCGPFVAALEEAAGRPAVLTGKPSPLFFESVLSRLGLPPHEVAMIGDDLESDVGGARRAGMRGILVRTGKWREGDLERSAVRPDAVLPSLAALPDLLSWTAPPGPGKLRA